MTPQDWQICKGNPVPSRDLLDEKLHNTGVYLNLAKEIYADWLLLPVSKPTMPTTPALTKTLPVFPTPALSTPTFLTPAFLTPAPPTPTLPMPTFPTSTSPTSAYPTPAPTMSAPTTPNSITPATPFTPCPKVALVVELKNNSLINSCIVVFAMG